MTASEGARELRPLAGLSRGLRRWRSRGGLAAVVLVLPGVLVFTYFAWIPVVRSIVMGFQQTNFVTDSSWVGIKNFIYVLRDPLLPTATLNTLWFTILAVFIGFPVPIFLAVFMGELRRRRAIFSVLAYLPVVIPPVAGILLWKTFYSPSPTGIFNTILGWIGIGAQPWLNSGVMAMPAIVFEATWASAGATAIIYVASLGTIRGDLYEAAELDGASIFRRIWHVTIPQLRGIILVLLLLQLIGTMQVFTEPFVFTGGGPSNATLTVLMLIFRYAFVDANYGAAAALSVILAIGLAVISAVYQIVTRRWSSR